MRHARRTLHRFLLGLEAPRAEFTKHDGMPFMPKVHGSYPWLKEMHREFRRIERRHAEARQQRSGRALATTTANDVGERLGLGGRRRATPNHGGAISSSADVATESDPARLVSQSIRPTR